MLVDPPPHLLDAPLAVQRVVVDEVLRRRVERETFRVLDDRQVVLPPADAPFQQALGVALPSANRVQGSGCQVYLKGY